MNPESCPNCGAEVPRHAKACPECGSCEDTGWSETAESAGLDLPDEEFDYDEFVKRELEHKEPGRSWVRWVAGGLIIVTLIWLVFR